MELYNKVQKTFFLSWFDTEKNAQPLGKEKISGDGPYLHCCFVLLITCSNTISCTRAYFCPSLILKRMNRNSEKEISSDGAYIHVFLCYYSSRVAQ